MRKKKMDFSKISEEDYKLLSEEIKKQLNEIANKALKDANHLLNVYGIKCTSVKMEYEEIDKEQ